MPSCSTADLVGSRTCGARDTCRLTAVPIEEEQVARKPELWVSPWDLKLDLRNPRMPDDIFDSEDEALEYLAQAGSLEELIDSIGNAGWLDYEPLIILEDTGEVIEGNRRLAALRIIRDETLAARLGFKLPNPMHDDAIPDEVRVWKVKTRKEARDFIGFKHINGPFKWDSFAKAKYAAEWLVDEPDLEAVSNRLGDTHKTVERLVNGYKLLQQAEKVGFNREDIPGRFAFSHLYTAITRPSIREFIGLPEGVGLLEPDPVPMDKTTNLYQLMEWLYGQGETRPAVRSQNPDLKRLAEALTNPTATAMLAESPDLDAAYALVEDKPSKFGSELFELSATAKRVASLIGHYEGDQEHLRIAEGILKTVRGIYQSMQAEVEDPVSLDGQR